MAESRKAKFTPGPYKIELGHDPEDFIVTDSTGATLCEPNVHVVPNEYDETVHVVTAEEAWGNAMLFAASWDMAEALQAVRELLEQGWLVRNTAGDDDPAWAAKALPNLAKLARVEVALGKAGL